MSGRAGLQVRGLRRGASGKHSTGSFNSGDILRNPSNRDGFQSERREGNITSPSPRIIPNKQSSKYHHQQQTSTGSFREKVQVEGNNAFISNRDRDKAQDSDKSKLEPIQPSKLSATETILKPKKSDDSHKQQQQHHQHHQQHQHQSISTGDSALEKQLAESLSSLQQQQLTKAPTNTESIIIHVCDEARGVNRDFPCDRKTLLAEMRYFRAYLANEDGSRKGEDVDISVHCDVNIFEWLVGFMQTPNQPPVLESATVVSILISSDFLEMDKLVNFCLSFMATHLEEIIRMPIDLSCIPDRLVQKLADRVDASLLGGLRDKRDKLLSKLYKRRLELDFRNPPLDARRGGGMSKICCCKWCGRLFHFASASLVVCDRAPVSVDFRGSVVSRHLSLKDWSLTECVSRLHRHGMSWGDIYWLLWGVSHVFYCAITRSAFAASDLSRRRIHPQPPTASVSGFPTHPCCGALKLHFDVLGARHGCSGCGGCGFADHHVDDERGAVCFIGPVRMLRSVAHSSFNRDQRADKEEFPDHLVQTENSSSSSPASSPKSSSPKKLSPKSTPSASTNGWITARRLLECQRDQLVTSSQHPAMLQEIVAVLRARAAENLLLRPPSPEAIGTETSTDKTGLIASATNAIASVAAASTSDKRPSTPGRSKAKNTAKKAVARKGISPEEMEAEKEEVEKLVNDLDSLGPRDPHAVFRSVPCSDDPSVKADETRLIQPSQHPLTLFPEECSRDLEFFRQAVQGGKLDTTRRRTWEYDLLREQDLKRMVLLSRLVHQKRLPLPPPPPDLVNKSNSNQGSGQRKKEREGANMSRRWR